MPKKTFKYPHQSLIWKSKASTLNRFRNLVSRKIYKMFWNRLFRWKCNKFAKAKSSPNCHHFPGYQIYFFRNLNEPPKAAQLSKNWLIWSPCWRKCYQNIVLFVSTCDITILKSWFRIHLWLERISSQEQKLKYLIDEENEI
jgi:hypothetical protein